MRYIKQLISILQYLALDIFFKSSFLVSVVASRKCAISGCKGKTNRFCRKEKCKVCASCECPETCVGSLKSCRGRLCNSCDYCKCHKKFCRGRPNKFCRKELCKRCDVCKITTRPSTSPSSPPSFYPVGSQKSIEPSSSPSIHASFGPTAQDKTGSSMSPSYRPSMNPSTQVTTSPSTSPSNHPSLNPTSQDTTGPSTSPSNHPSLNSTGVQYTRLYEDTFIYCTEDNNFLNNITVAHFEEQLNEYVQLHSRCVNEGISYSHITVTKPNKPDACSNDASRRLMPSNGGYASGRCNSPPRNCPGPRLRAAKTYVASQVDDVDCVAFNSMPSPQREKSYIDNWGNCSFQIISRDLFSQGTSFSCNNKVYKSKTKNNEFCSCYNGFLSMGESCSDNSNCDGEMECLDGLCGPLDDGYKCYTSGQCKNSKCNKAIDSGICGQVKNGYWCNKNSQCESGCCKYGFTCGDPNPIGYKCWYDGDCAANLKCIGKKCAPNKDVGGGGK